MKRQYTATERLGINAVEAIVLSCGCIFREQPVSDFGIDGHIEVCIHGRPTGRLIAAQIRSGESYFKEPSAEGFVYRGSKEHLEYWLGHSLPVILVLYHPGLHQAWWCSITPQTVEQTPKGCRVIVPYNQRLNDRSLALMSQLALPKLTTMQLPTDPRRPLSSLFDALKTAQHEIAVVSPIIDDKLFWALSATAHRAIHVRLLSGSYFPETLRVAARAAANAHMEWRALNSSLHAKFVAIDRKFVLQGSANFTLGEYLNPLEKSFAPDENKPAAEVCSFFDEAWKIGDTVVGSHQ